jgi:probable F420-dependent oxidoreductase
MVKLGASFPQTEIGTDPAVIREWAQTVEEMGFDYVVALDHVLGARPGHPALEGTPFSYTSESLVHEPLILFGYLAALTQRVELVSGIIILPQRQTALVAKQAAEVDVLSGGRLRLGVGLGWNPVEFEALGEDFHNRGRRIEEQVEVMRRLWTEEVITFHGKWHEINEAGIHPRPVRRPIPVWFGATSDRAIERAGRIGDGWLAMGRPESENERRVQLFRDSIERAGRSPSAVGLQVGLGGRGPSGPDVWRHDVDAWRRLGATHITVGTVNAGHTSIADHLVALASVRQVLEPMLV